MKKLILTDCDGVLLNWNDGFNKFMSQKGFPQIPNTDHEYNISVRHNISTKDALKFMREYNEGEGVEHLEPFADSVKYVNKLSRLGFRFIVVTSISNHPDAKIRRVRNLENVFGKVFDDVHCIEMGASKAFTLMEWADTGYFWIEDHMRQAEAGYEAGLRPILINHPYNTHYKTDLFRTVSYETPWKNIFDIVCTEYNLVPI